jgi:hypothetical protein
VIGIETIIFEELQADIRVLQLHRALQWQIAE